MEFSKFPTVNSFYDMLDKVGQKINSIKYEILRKRTSNCTPNFG